ncbi:regulatory protein [Paramaledivibacter caminithermalis DSM 15212]|uniref:Regulatory protein RecX n=1 Tax=Paramaledivibacter caminithermalis (strain DSM 15212 / CIP 107654 / DViRD3) TaxID=1121301 RepID=A0A1M6PUI2_PARC5|nr:regulatory protein [Paramaledivibacter caminithermalis DSM 15212]
MLEREETVLLKKEFEITKLETQKRNNNRISVYINNKYAFGVHKDIIYKLNLEKGKLVDQNFIEKIIKTEEQKKAKDYAIKILSYRPRSQKEIKDKLEQKGYENQVVNRTLAWLREYKLIDDKEFAKEYIKSKGEKYGGSRIKIELIRKGVEEEIIDSVLNDKLNDEKEYEIALEQAKKKMKAYKGDEREAVYRKLGYYLQRRGFSYDIISKILRELL